MLIWSPDSLARAAACDEQSSCDCLGVGCVLQLTSGIPRDVIAWEDRRVYEGFRRNLKTVSAVAVRPGVSIMPDGHGLHNCHGVGCVLRLKFGIANHLFGARVMVVENDGNEEG